MLCSQDAHTHARTRARARAHTNTHTNTHTYCTPQALGREMEYLTEIGYCLNHDAMYKWAVIMRSIQV